MGFLKFLRGIGDRIGILETVCEPGQERVTVIRTRTVTLRELEVEVRSPEVRALAESPSEIAVPMEKIFETAGIAPNPRGWSVDKLIELTQSEAVRGKPKEEARRAVLEAISAAGVAAEDIVKDAMARDRALDAFEESGALKLREHAAAGERKLREIEARIEALRDESARLREKLKEDEKAWNEWRRGKRAYEKEMAAAVSYVVDKPSITTDEQV